MKSLRRRNRTQPTPDVIDLRGHVDTRLACPNCGQTAGWNEKADLNRFECAACGFWVLPDGPAPHRADAPKTLSL